MAGTSILFVSNGYGEDTIATSIIRSLMEEGCPHSVLALPLVGEGKAYAAVGSEVIGPRRLMPSGGMIPGNMGNLVNDMANGLVRLTMEQIAVIRKIRKDVALTAAVGDIYPVILSALFSSRPLVMVGTAKSDYFYHYNWIERILIGAGCEAVFTRDEITAQSLRKHHIKAYYVGNAMMDSLAFSDEDFPLSPGMTPIGILPGSRYEAYGDIPVILGAVEALWSLMEKKVSFRMSFAETLDRARLNTCIEACRWSMLPGEGNDHDVLIKDDLRVVMVKGRFGDLLRSSKIIIGQAGTGNEQATGLGKPVVTFDSGGKEGMGWYRKRQKGLLGDAISVVKRDSRSIADEVISIIGDEERYQAMAHEGHVRMGSPGAARKMAELMLALLSKVS
jgi:uncharacterized protein (TIGR03492 family)